MQIVRLDSVESTNKYCEVLDLAEVEDFTCYWALEQTAGIGQRGNHWHSAPGLNLTFSLVIKPVWLAAARQFMLTQAISLAITDFLATYHLPQTTHIKWPNDIYVGRKKICGTLTSARLAGDYIATAICGIGLNVNETDFPDWVPNPTSLRQLTGETYDPEEVLHTLLACIEHRYNALRDGADISAEYLGLLLGRGEQRRYTYLGQPVTATIEGVDDYGRLLLTTDEGSQLCCNMKELAYSWL